MNFIEIMQTMSALSGIAIIMLGSSWLKRMLRRGF